MNPVHTAAFAPEPERTIRAHDQEHDLQTAFAFIISYKHANDGNSPTIREIGQACGISSTSFVSNILYRLEHQGLIRLPKIVGVSRHIHVVGGQWTYAPKERQKEGSDAICNADHC